MGEVYPSSVFDLNVEEDRCLYLCKIPKVMTECD